MRVTFHDEAEAELLEIGQYYDKERPGLGREFGDEFQRVVAVILAGPNRFAIEKADVRRHSLKRFPYSILYRIASEDEVQIVAVSHHRRRPGYWQDRLKH